ncbi:MAG: cation:proton antiporter [Oligoflexia bacterium]|nr:cation:proton antiporter [Oligoflexia bacterium]
MHLAPLIRDLAVILAVAGLVTLVFQRIRQPVVLGYIIAGIIVGPHVLPGAMVADIPNIRIWAELGVIFLMFSLGLDFSFRKLAKVGLSSSFTAAFEVSVMLGVGYLCGRLLGWRTFDAVFLGAILAISSTTVIIKALDELGLRTRRFSELIFGVLIVEDLVAVLILVALSTAAVSTGFSGLALLLSTGKLVLVIGTWFLVGYFAVPRFVRYVGKVGNDEMLTILSLGLCLFLAVLASAFNYSVALGAFIMGSILAESTESHRIGDLIAPLKDLFAAIFFVSIGMLMDPVAILANIGPILLITVVYVVAKITAVTVAALLSGQTLRTSIQVGFGLAQIGEFSFIIATLGQSLRVTSDFLFPIAVAVSLITTFMTPYLIRVSHDVAVLVERRLPVPARELLGRYAAWSQERRAGHGKREAFYRLFLRWALNGLTVTAVFILVGETVLPFFRWKLSLSPALASSLGWGVAVVLSAPFLWAMLSLFKGFRLSDQEEAPPHGGLLFVIRILTGFWIGMVSLKFFAARYAVVFIGAFIAILFVVFYRQLEASYRWFETRFLSTFDAAPKSPKKRDVLKHLAPWDAHLVRIKVHPNAEIAGRKIRDVALRKKYGLNIVAIQRGLRTIVAPSPEEMLFPKDELLVLGTDEQIESVRFEIEKPPGLDTRYQNPLAGYELKSVLLAAGSELCGLSIRQTGIGERFGAMIVGLERGDRRIINPDSGLTLVAGDILWVVGETEKLSQLAQGPTAS